ncbi:hypothetical protein STEG23_036477 [Scotinomys teguina]
MKFAGKWKELENIILSEVTQTQKDKHGAERSVCLLEHCVHPVDVPADIKDHADDPDSTNIGTGLCLTNCWKWDENALLVHLLEILLMPLKALEEYPVYLYRPKRNFDITAAILAAIAVSATAATHVGIAVSQNVQTVTIVNKLADKVSSALDLKVK